METEIVLAERDRANEALKESEQRYKRLLAATTDYIYTVSIEHGLSRSTYHGPGCEAVTGYAPADFTSEPYLWYRIIHEEDRPSVLAQFERILHGELPPPLEHRIICRNGALRWIRNTTIPHRDGSGRLVAYDGVISDITERKRSERELRESEQKFRVLFESSRDATMMLNRSRFFDCNPATLEIFGCDTKEQFVGMHPSQLSPPQQANGEDSRVAAARQIETAYAKGSHFFEWLHQRRDGTVFPAEVLLSRFELRGESALQAVVRDITERKRVETELRESQERLALVIRGSNDGIWDWNITTNEAYFSPRGKAMLGYEDHEIGNRFSAWEQLIHPDDRAAALARREAYLAGQLPVFELEHRLRHKDGSYRWILARGVVLRDATGKPVRMAGSHMDLTERKQFAERLQQANVELQEMQSHLIQAARFESIGTLAAGVAHEVKNPLQTILMGLRFLAQRLPAPDPEVALTMSDMREGVTRANTIVGELLALSKPEEFHPAPECLNPLIERSLQLLHRQVEAAGVTVTLNLAPDLPPARLDHARLRQVFLNLSLNSVQAMPGGGTLTITTRVLTLSADPAAIPPAFRCFKPASKLVVAEVRDTGTGIKETDLPRVFDPFFTTKPVGVGTGLGLSMAKRIIERHGGVIQINNAPPAGVLVTIALAAEPEERP
jgi:PAS domain S-box-containing protein